MGVISCFWKNFVKTLSGPRQGLPARAGAVRLQACRIQAFVFMPVKRKFARY